MNDISRLNPDFVAVAGDWHGNLYQAKRVLDFLGNLANTPTVVLQVGDFGIWHGFDGGRFLKGLNLALASAGTTLLFVDGNHENFNELYEYPLHEDGYRRIRSNIIHLPRGFRWEWYGVKFAALGGAHSVDRDHRTEGESWWPQEWVSDDELEAFRDGGPADVVVMHDSPAGAPNSVTDDPLRQLDARKWFGSHNIDLAEEHRRRLATAVDPVDPAIIVHGHFHQAMQGCYTREGGRECFVFGLDEGAANLNHHVFIMDVLQIQAELEHAKEIEA